MVPSLLRSGWFWVSFFAWRCLFDAAEHPDPGFALFRLGLMFVGTWILGVLLWWLWLGFAAARKHAAKDTYP